jgi:hypothetical protein
MSQRLTRWQGALAIAAVLALIVTTILSVAPALACVLPDNGGGTATLLDPVCPYFNEPAERYLIIDGLPAGTTIEGTGPIRDFHCPGIPFSTMDMCTLPGGTLGGDFASFDALLDLHLMGTGALAGFNRFVTLPLFIGEAHYGPRAPGAPLQAFPTEMFRMQGQLPPGDPDFDLLRITGGIAFGLPSPGHTTLTQVPGGDWAVDSFFDITYRIDFVGSPGSVLGGMSGSTTATIRVRAVGGAVPVEAQTWGAVKSIYSD